MDAYNVKVIQYPNGSYQIRKYSTAIRAKSPADLYEKYTLFEDCKHEKYKKSQFDLLLNGDVDYIRLDGKIYTLSPFDGCIVEKSMLNAHDRNTSSDIIHSLNRTKSKIYTYARCVKWQWFITFTFSNEKTNRYDYDECSRLVRSWLHNQRRNAPDLQYLIVPEQHKDGAWHFHGLLANTGKIKFSDSGKKDKKGKKIYNMSKWTNGFTTATAVGDIYKVSNYIGKYITKELCEITKGKQRYFVSQNMLDPTESVFFVDENNENFIEFLSVLVDSLGCDIVHVSECKNENAFVGVDYYELKKGSDTTGRNQKAN